VFWELHLRIRKGFEIFLQLIIRGWEFWFETRSQRNVEGALGQQNLL